MSPCFRSKTRAAQRCDAGVPCTRGARHSRPERRRAAALGAALLPTSAQPTLCPQQPPARGAVFERTGASRRSVACRCPSYRRSAFAVVGVKGQLQLGPVRPNMVSCQVAFSTSAPRALLPSPCPGPQRLPALTRVPRPFPKTPKTGPKPAGHLQNGQRPPNAARSGRRGQQPPHLREYATQAREVRLASTWTAPLSRNGNAYAGVCETSAAWQPANTGCGAGG